MQRELGLTDTELGRHGGGVAAVIHNTGALIWTTGGSVPHEPN